jgi:DNA repair photolyase
MRASLPLLPDSEPRLVGIARIASHSESVRHGHDVEYFTLAVKSVLNRCSGARMPFTWTINPYRGCEFACKYCYARYTHEFMEIRNSIEFEQKIFVKQHTAELLRQELRRVKRGEDIAIGTATDPYQPIEKKLEVTRSILEELALHSGLEIGIVTKSAMVVRDADVLGRISERNRVTVNITVTTTDADLARILEPRAPRPDLRLDALKNLRAAGIRAGVICAPVLPGITDSPRRLEDVVRMAASAGACHVYGNPLFLKPCSASVFLPFLNEHFPHLVSLYKERFSDRAFLPVAYRKRISALFDQFRAKCKIRQHAIARWDPPVQFEEQLRLF